MALFGFGKKKQDPPAPAAAKSVPLVPPEKEIISSQTFTQAKSFRGFRRIKIQSRNSEMVSRNEEFFKQHGYDFTNRTVQLMVAKIQDGDGFRVLIIVDGRFIGNLYKNNYNAEAFEKIMDGAVDGVFIKYDETVIDGKSYGAEAFIFLHWPGIGPKASVK